MVKPSKPPTESSANATQAGKTQNTAKGQNKPNAQVHSQPLSAATRDTGATPNNQQSFRASVLNPIEEWWQGQGKWLDTHGYTLRPRYQTGWSASWKKGGGKQSALARVKCEDGQIIGHAYTLDAIRKRDGKQVCLKRIKLQEHPFEVSIARRLSETQSPHIGNHCVPIYEVLHPPGDREWAILVMPLLLPFDMPKWETVGEVTEFIRQIIEGLNYIHSRGVAHRDCGVLNIMMEPSQICPGGFHPIARHMNPNFTAKAKYLTRTETKPKYYFIDFGISEQYDLSKQPIRAKYVGSGDKSVPEFQGRGRGQLYDPFAADVYMLGNVIRTTFLEGPTRQSLDFLQPLISEMTATDPAKRPKMTQVLTKYELALANCPDKKLWARLAGSGGGVFAGFSHWLKMRKFRKKGLSAIPSPLKSKNQVIAPPFNPMVDMDERKPISKPRPVTHYQPQTPSGSKGANTRDRTVSVS